MATSLLYSGSRFWPGEEPAAILDSHPRWTADVFNKFFLQRLKRSLALRILVRAEQMKFWIGTSGFQYAEWKGNFYPEDLPAAKMLAFYAERLSTTEINYTFHRIPATKTIDNWKMQTPEEFRFALKAPQKITHWSKLRDCADTLGYFCKVISELGERQGPVLFQLPPNFKKDADVLSSFLREFPNMRAAFEFRHESWFDDEILDLLKSRNIALCIADTADLATPKKITADYGYLRLRREDYVKSDVEQWSEFVRVQRSNWKDAFVYFKHEESGIGPKLATQMMELLG
jgi:uncharacterized protein YecE (DUF72 family)